MRVANELPFAPRRPRVHERERRCELVALVGRAHGEVSDVPSEPLDEAAVRLAVSDR
jgi:hypothetical protein